MLPKLAVRVRRSLESTGRGPGTLLLWSRTAGVTMTCAHRPPTTFSFILRVYTER